MMDGDDTMNEYALVVEHEIIKFVKECNVLIKEGWTPQGGASAHQGYNRSNFTQAFVR